MQIQYFDVLAQSQKHYARLMEPVCKKWELTKNELDVLLFLANNPGQDRAADIVRGRGLSKSHVSASVSSLVQRGRLSRWEDPSDRRAEHLELYGDAMDIVQDGRMAQKRFFEAMHVGISQEEREAIASYSRKVCENIRNMDVLL